MTSAAPSQSSAAHDGAAPANEAAGGSSAGGLARQAARGTAWVFLGYGLGQLMRLVGNVIVTNKVWPETYGLMAIVNTFLLGLTMFSDFGIGPSIVQNRRGEEPRFLDTLWTVQAARGLALSAFAVLAAWPMSAFYGRPELLHVLPVTALSALVQGLASTKLWTANRRLAMGRLTAIELSSQAVGLAVMIVWASLTRSVWSLVAGSVVTAALKTLLSHVALGGHANRFAWDHSAVRELVHFSRWIFVSTILTFCVMQSDRLVFGKLIPLPLLGVYAIAVMIGTLPQTSLNYVWGQVVFPIFSRFDAGLQGAELSRAFSRVRWPLLALGGWMVSGLIAGGPTAIEWLWKPDYAPAGWMIQVLAAGGWFQVLVGASDAALLARGRTGALAACNLVKLIAMLVLIPIGFAWQGFPGALMGYCASDVPRYLAALSCMRSMQVAQPARDLGWTLLVAATGLAGAALAHWLYAEHVAVSVRAVAIAVAVSCAWAPFARRIWARRRLSAA